MSGRVVNHRPETGAWVDVGLGSDLILHSLDLRRIDGGRVTRGCRVSGRVRPFLPDEHRVGLIPDLPGYDEPFPLEVVMTGRVVNSDRDKAFIRLGGSVDAVLRDTRSGRVLAPGDELQVRIANVDWASDPSKPRITVDAVDSESHAEQPARRVTKPHTPTFIVDGSNLQQRFGTAPDLGAVEAVQSLIRDACPGARILSFYDRSVLERLDGRSSFTLGAAQLSGDAIVAFEGLEADVLILAAARKLDAVVVSLDRFDDHSLERDDVSLLDLIEPDGRLRLGRIKIFTASGQPQDVALEEHVRSAR